MFLKVGFFCSPRAWQNLWEVQWKFYHPNKGKIIGLLNELSFILIFLVVSVIQTNISCWKLSVRCILSTSVHIESQIHWFPWKSMSFGRKMRKTDGKLSVYFGKMAKIIFFLHEKTRKFEKALSFTHCT